MRKPSPRNPLQKKSRVFIKQKRTEHELYVLCTHHVVTVVLPAADGRVLRIRKGTTPERDHRDIYRVLAIPDEVMKPVKTWSAS